MTKHGLGFIALCSIALLAYASPTVALSQNNKPDLREDRDGPMSERQKAINLYEQGNNKGAIAILQSLVKKTKTDFLAWYYLGLAFNRLDKVSDARKAFQMVTQLRPDFGEGHIAFAYLLSRTGKMDEAFDEAHKALELNSDSATAHYVLALVAVNRKSPKDALEEIELSLKANPSFGPTHLLKSQLLLSIYLDEVPVTRSLTGQDSISARAARDARIKEAAVSLENYLQLEPNNPDLNFWREQLQTLKAHTNSGNEKVFSSRDVTTKVRVLSKPAPYFPEDAKNAGMIGTVVLRAVFAADARVKHILVVRSLPYGLTEESVKAAKQIKFVPATKDGLPVSVFMQLEYHFAYH